MEPVQMDCKSEPVGLCSDAEPEKWNQSRWTAKANRLDCVVMRSQRNGTSRDWCGENELEERKKEGKEVRKEERM
jgi:hypothetical protein